jgi:hypothetical protein
MKPVAWIVNLDRRTDRWSAMVEKWSDTFELKRVPAVDGAARRLSPELCCKLSHFLLFDELKKTPAEIRWFPVLEDDVFKTEQWTTMWPQICEFLNSRREQDWDFISLDPFLHFDAHGARPYGHGFVEINKFRNTGFILYSRRFIEKFERKTEPITGAIDMTFTHSPRWRKLTPSRLCVRQEPDTLSDINGRVNSHRQGFWDKTEEILLTIHEPASS